MLLPQIRISRACAKSSGSIPDRRADRVEVAFEPGLGTDRARQAAGPHLLEEAVGDAVLLQKTHRAAVGIGQNRLRPPFVDDALQARRDRRQRLAPGDTLETAAAFRPHTAQRVRQPVGVVHPLQIAVDLAAERALRDRMIGVAPDIQRPLACAIHRNLPTARIRAVVRACARDDADRRILFIKGEFCHGIGS